jgi:hypothetical protein
MPSGRSISRDMTKAAPGAAGAACGGIPRGSVLPTAHAAVAMAKMPKVLDRTRTA